MLLPNIGGMQMIKGILIVAVIVLFTLPFYYRAEKRHTNKMLSIKRNWKNETKENKVLFVLNLVADILFGILLLLIFGVVIYINL